MLTGRDITIEIGGRTLVRDASFVIGPRDKVGLVGPNGAGKSSLLGFLLGEAPRHLKATGEVRRTGTVGYLPQVPVPEGLGIDTSAFSHVLSARGLDVLDDELHRARRALQESPTEARVADFSRARGALPVGRRLRGRGGARPAGRRPRLPQELFFADVGSLSGGQRRRVDLIRVLFEQPALMILDEPTNHLDRAAKLWLMDELAESRRALLVVSHDLRLLDRAISKVLQLANQSVREFKGNYSAFRGQLEADIAGREKAAGMESAKISKMRAQADKWRHCDRDPGAQGEDPRPPGGQARGQPDPGDQARPQGHVQAARAGPLRRGGAARRGPGRHLRRPQGAPRRRTSSSTAATGWSSSAGTGPASPRSCAAWRRSRNRATGRSSSAIGSTSATSPRSTSRSTSTPTRSTNLDDTVLVKESDRRSLLGSFGLTGATAAQRAGSLSGGERARLSLAMLAAGRANLLVLDEPTNNLDPASVSAIGAMLGAWKGTIVAVSHDAPLRRGASRRPTRCTSPRSVTASGARSTSTTSRCADRRLPSRTARFGCWYDRPTLGSPLGRPSPVGEAARGWDRRGRRGRSSGAPARPGEQRRPFDRLVPVPGHLPTAARRLSRHRAPARTGGWRRARAPSPGPAAPSPPIRCTWPAPTPPTSRCSTRS